MLMLASYRCFFVGLLLLAGLGTSWSRAETYAHWAALHFGDAVNDPSKEATVWGTNADPDRDGRANLMEYALGNDPVSGADASAGIFVELKPAAEGGTERYLHATVIQRTTDPGLQFIPQVSSDGQTWQEGPGFVETLPPEPIAPDFNRVIYRDRSPASPDQPRFFRLKLAITDTDGDGLPDDWERTYFGDLAQSATGDPDTDGLINRKR